MDIVPVEKSDFAGKHTDVYGKNSREQWKYENHKTLFGNKGGSITAHHVDQIDNGKKPRQQASVNAHMQTAGEKNWNPS